MTPSWANLEGPWPAGKKPKKIILLQVQRLVYLLWKKVWKIDHRLSELQEEGINAINLPLSPIPFELDPEDTMLEENEVRTMIDPNSRSDPKLQELIKVLIDWINDVLVGERIIVKDLAEDMYDGQVLQKLFEKLESEKLNVAEVTQSEIAQKQKLQTVLEKINETLKLPPRSIKWTVDSVHAKSLVAILRLLVALSQYFRAPIRLPDHVSIQVVVVQKREGILQSRQIQEEITGNTEALSGRYERDAFDTLFDHAPDKLNVVKKTLITFVNKHLNKLNLEVTELETQFRRDGCASATGPAESELKVCSIDQPSRGFHTTEMGSQPPVPPVMNPLPSYQIYSAANDKTPITTGLFWPQPLSRVLICPLVYVSLGSVYPWRHNTV
ncbi:alpha-parvin isoform X2 [Chelonia mydas]|uniref:alpha-parvin isoform X2 n=1 Tax=Chelonia mydas TaxID=8469 RepID=UPI0018A20AD3|nr:alpha-parvin isoform X2 [Chelonia mydas]